MFEGNDIAVFAGPMVTVLGTSLQNRDLLKFSSINLGVIGLEMEGSYYQKAIQSASKNSEKYLRILKYDTLIMHQITL
jgi:hypothetical protein